MRAPLRSKALGALNGLLIARTKALSALDRDRRVYAALRSRFFRALWEETAKQLGATVEDLGDGYLRIERRGAATFVNQSDVMLDSRLVLKLAGHKPLVHRILAEASAPDVRYVELDLATLRTGERFLEEIDGPAVIKPAVSGSAGSGVVTGIDSPARLRRAALAASGYGTRLLLEEQIEGDSYRLLYLRGRLIDAVRRDRPHVVGDGRSTIRQLVAEENGRRRGGDVRSLHPLTVDLEMRFFLAAAGRSPGDVPAAAERVEVKRAVNQNSLFENFSVTPDVHPETVAMGARIAAALQVELAGIDMICRDVARPLSATGGVINEVNTTPGLHHHYLVANRDPSTSVAAEILEALLTR